MKNKKLEQWLQRSPLPVVARVMDNVEDLRMLALSATLYQKGTLVVVPIALLDQLIKSIQKP